MIKYYKANAYIYYALYDNCAITVKIFTDCPSISVDTVSWFQGYKEYNRQSSPFRESTEAEFNEAYQKVFSLITNPEMFGKDG